MRVNTQSRCQDFHARQLDKKTLYKTVKQQRHSVYRGSKLWIDIPKDLLSIPYHAFIKLYKQLLFQIQISLIPGIMYPFASFEAV